MKETIQEYLVKMKITKPGIFIDKSFEESEVFDAISYRDAEEQARIKYTEEAKNYGYVFTIVEISQLQPSSDSEEVE